MAPEPLGGLSAEIRRRGMAASKQCAAVRTVLDTILPCSMAEETDPSVPGAVTALDASPEASLCTQSCKLVVLDRLLNFLRAGCRSYGASGTWPPSSRCVHPLM